MKRKPPEPDAKVIEAFHGHVAPHMGLEIDHAQATRMVASGEAWKIIARYLAGMDAYFGLSRPEGDDHEPTVERWRMSFPEFLQLSEQAHGVGIGMDDFARRLEIHQQAYAGSCLIDNNFDELFAEKG